MLVNSTQLCELLSPNLLSGSPPLSPSQSQSTVYTDHHTDSVRLEVGGGGGVLNCVEDHILQEFDTLFLSRFRTYKLAFHSKQKPRRGGGLRQISTCRKKSLYMQVNFLDSDIRHCFLSV